MFHIKTLKIMLNEELLDQLQEEKVLHDYDYHTGHPALYVGTYGKYNDGSLDGMWVDLTTFSDYDDFMNFCYLLHNDEDYPEFMFQDYENFPRELYKESMSRKDWEKLSAYTELSDNDREVFDAYVELRGWYDDLTWEWVSNIYQGQFLDEEDFARHLVEELYANEVHGILGDYFDYERFARDLFLDDYVFNNGHVFCLSI